MYWQFPAYVLTAISEVLTAVAVIAYAYTMVPKSMKSLAMVVYLATTSLALSFRLHCIWSDSAASIRLLL
ncbi:Peptide transporter PTR2 [Beauveria bassiana]|uniref:Peptide transporter PTR2 n=1 Tax=Beauveria bassiana TaxID=176275 RepID=A0A2N6NE78_BEABA|nr:Peptide transporter PTR2 [Beauveria bassiana]